MGPLQGVKVLELAGLGPGPFCGMMLADMGADVVRVDRASGDANVIDIPSRFDIPSRNKRSIAIDLKSPAGVEMVLRLVETADVLIEPYRPGVAERLGIGPDVCAARNPKLVYGRVTGWGQTGPLSRAVGHDLNYVALSGALHAMGDPQLPPPPPLNLVGDYGGGAMYLGFGIVCALLEARGSGRGQVIDAAMLDGAVSMMSVVCGYTQAGIWNEQRGTNLLDGAAPFYAAYETSDGRYVTVAPIEPRFYDELVRLLGIDAGDQYDRAAWPERKRLLAKLFYTRTLAEWDELLAGSDACYAPVLPLAEAPNHPHNAERGTFQSHFGVVQPTPAPRLSRTAGDIRTPPPEIGGQSREIMAEWGVTLADADAAIETGCVVQRA